MSEGSFKNTYGKPLSIGFPGVKIIKKRGFTRLTKIRYSHGMTIKINKDEAERAKTSSTSFILIVCWGCSLTDLAEVPYELNRAQVGTRKGC